MCDEREREAITELDMMELASTKMRNMWRRLCVIITISTEDLLSLICAPTRHPRGDVEDKVVEVQGPGESWAEDLNIVRKLVMLTSERLDTILKGCMQTQKREK